MMNRFPIKVWLGCLVSIFCCKFLDAQLPETEFKELAMTRDIYILDEKRSVAIKGANANYMTVSVAEEITYQVNFPGGLSEINPIILPQPLDDDFFAHCPVIRNPGEYFSQVTIDHFEAEELKADGSSVLVKWEMVNRENRVISNEGFFGLTYSNLFYLTDKENPGVFRIRYRYSFPFRDNSNDMLSMRFFFHGILAKKNYAFTFEYPKMLYVDTKFLNGAEPMEEDTAGNAVIYRWSLENLPPAFADPASRLYLELPWVSVNPLPWSMLYEHFDSFEEKFIPPWYFLVYDKENAIRVAFNDIMIGVKDRDNLCFKKIENKFEHMAPNDSTGLARIRLLQRWMVDSIRYDNAFTFYNKEETYMHDRPCSFLAGGRLRDNSMEFSYANLIMRFDLPFFSAYLVDKRYGEVSEYYFAPLTDNEMLFSVVLNDNTLAYIYPKNDQANYYCEELPFYYENTPVLLIYTLDYAGYKRNFYEGARIINTPPGYMKDNYRRVNGRINLNLENNLMQFDTKVTLSGQFSTITRAVYTGDPVDTTVNLMYFEKPWMVSPDSRLVFSEKTEQQIYYPFRSNFMLSYRAEELLENEGGEYSIPLRGLLGHVIPFDIQQKYRFSDFYSDYCGTDSYVYLVEFDQPVKIVPYDRSVDNEFASYLFSVSQPSENSLLINSYLSVKKERVPLEDFGQIRQVFEAVSEIDSSSVSFRLK